MFIDTHCHLDAEEFGNTQEDLVRAAQKAGVTRLIVPSVARANFERVRQLCERFPSCAAAYGIHPMYIDTAMPDDLQLLRELLEKHRPVAIGEIGLDFFIEHYDRARQEYFFVEQLKLAKAFDLPVLLHIRRAQDVILKLLRQHKVKGGIAHAFNGSREQAEAFIKLGFKLGFGGAMTYGRATRLRTLAATLPLESIVLETDAPDILPAFLARGQPNKPEYLPRIAETLAALRGMPLAEIAAASTQNANRILHRGQGG